MTKSRPWRMALAMFLSLSLTLGFAQSAAAEPKAAANNVKLGVVVNSAKTGRSTLSESGDEIWVSVGSNGLDPTKKYTVAIALKDAQSQFSDEEVGLGAVLDHQCRVISNYCKTTTQLPVYEEKLAGHTLNATIIIYAIDGQVVAQDNSHWVKVPENYKPNKPKEPLNPQNPSEPVSPSALL